MNNKKQRRGRTPTADSVRQRLIKQLTKNGCASLEIKGERDLKAHRLAIAHAHQAARGLGVKVRTRRTGDFLLIELDSKREKASDCSL